LSPASEIFELTSEFRAVSRRHQLNRVAQNYLVFLRRRWINTIKTITASTPAIIWIVPVPMPISIPPFFND
jgi:hypothetical protein